MNTGSSSLTSSGNLLLETANAGAAQIQGGNTASLNAYARADELISTHQQRTSCVRLCMIRLLMRAVQVLAEAKTRFDTHSFVASLKGTVDLTRETQAREYEVPPGYRTSALPVPAFARARVRACMLMSNAQTHSRTAAQTHSDMHKPRTLACARTQADLDAIRRQCRLI